MRAFALWAHTHESDRGAEFIEQLVRAINETSVPCSTT
jgi:hypothetical protein